MTEAIELNERTQFIMGLMCFKTARYAHRLIELEIYPAPAEHKAEYEQAIFMHWALNLEAEHGENWNKEADKILFPDRKEGQHQ